MRRSGSSSLASAGTICTSNGLCSTESGSSSEGVSAQGEIGEIGDEGAESDDESFLMKVGSCGFSRKEGIGPKEVGWLDGTVAMVSGRVRLRILDFEDDGADAVAGRLEEEEEGEDGVELKDQKADALAEPSGTVMTTS